MKAGTDRLGPGAVRFKAHIGNRRNRERSKEASSNEGGTQAAMEKDERTGSESDRN